MMAPSVSGSGYQQPVIISASRSTDIPAFYADWFMNRLRAGYLVWKNPFNQKPLRVDLSHVAGIVFWSKNPRPLLPYLDEVAARGIDFYFQYTVNDYESAGFEPRVPPLAERIATFRELSNCLGRNRIIWRFDPICISEALDVDAILSRLSRLAEALGPLTRRLVISFVDIGAYRKVQHNIARVGAQLLREPTFAEQDALAAGISRIAKQHELLASACGESRSFSQFGIPHARCIDGELFAEIC